jgi:hypothetical protein
MIVTVLWLTRMKHGCHESNRSAIALEGDYDLNCVGIVSAGTPRGALARLEGTERRRRGGNMHDVTARLFDHTTVAPSYTQKAFQSFLFFLLVDASFLLLVHCCCEFIELCLQFVEPSLCPKLAFGSLPGRGREEEEGGRRGKERGRGKREEEEETLFER